ncbi:helix-turn-helix domain-containing protein [Nocardioides sp. MH1]|uniref:helix-turn-helix domain-containing protein n=1 Tax=Nocardioides sp. MH1 TaxID=3242490 RepID=UPI003521105D
MLSPVTEPCAGTFARLHRAVVAAAEQDTAHDAAHAATLGVLDRAHRADAGEFRDVWALFAAAAVEDVGRPGWERRAGVMANLIGLAVLGEPQDFVALDRLTEHYGRATIATVQNTVDGLLGTGETMPLATRAVTRLTFDVSVEELVLASGGALEDAVVVADRCRRAALRLVMVDVDPARPGPVLTAAEDVLAAWDRGGLPAWRAQLAVVAANPWAPYGTELRDLAQTAGRAVLAEALEECVRVYRSRNERTERDLVAREIRELVALSGLSQREFAAMLGTSASRLSTYVNGLVTPSATLMLRIRRVSALLQEQRQQPGR